MADGMNKPAIRFAGFTDAWEQRKYGEVVETRRGLTYKPSDICDSGIRVLRSSNIDEDTFVLKADDVFVKKDAVNIDYSKENDILITSANGSSRLVGKHAIISSISGNPAVHGGFMLLGTTKEPYFINASMGSSWYRRFIELYVAGGNGAIGNLNKNDLDNQVILIPSEPEQRAIGAFFKQLDHLITLHQREYAKLVNIKASMLEKMFPKDGSAYPEVRFAGFTDAWEQRKFEDAFIERREKTVTENEDTLLSCAINGMFLNSELFGHFRGTTTIGYLKVKKNDLILSAQNLHLGNANVNLRFEHGIISPAYKVYDLNNCEPEFVQAWVKKEDTKNFFLAATTEGASQCRKNIEWDTLGKQTICMPAIKEQATIGSFFKCVDNLITLHQRKLEKLQNIKKSMLEKMFV